MKLIESERLIFRRLRKSDADFFYELESDPKVFEHLPPGRPYTRDRVTSDLQKRIYDADKYGPFGFWIVEEKRQKCPIAWALLIQDPSGEYRLGYVVAKPYWGQGYATEIADHLCEYGFSNGLTEISAVTTPGNLASIRVLEKIGFKQTRQFQCDNSGEILNHFLKVTQNN